MPKEIKKVNLPNGQPYCECEYEGGVAHGRFTSWHMDGSPFEEGQYVNGKRDGQWTLRTSDGRVETTMQMKDDVLVHLVKRRNGSVVEDKHFGPDGKEVDSK